MCTCGLHLELRRSRPGRRDLVLSSDGRMDLWRNSHKGGKLVANRMWEYLLLFRAAFFH